MSKAWLSILIWNYNFIQDRWQMLLPCPAAQTGLNRNWKFESLDLLQILLIVTIWAAGATLFCCSHCSPQCQCECDRGEIHVQVPGRHWTIPSDSLSTNWTLPPVFATTDTISSLLDNPDFWSNFLFNLTKSVIGPNPLHVYIHPCCVPLFVTSENVLRHVS